MTELTRYELNEGVATITIDDGKVNALSTAMSTELMTRFDRAEDDGAVVLLTGRASTFSAGFDLRCEQSLWPEMMLVGARLSQRMLTFPYPVVIACNGNAIAMGALLLNAGDYRIGVDGDYRIGLNEVTLGMVLPAFAVELARHRLTRRYFDICTVTGTMLGPREARSAGFLDRLVTSDGLGDTAADKAAELTSIDMGAHLTTKLRVREGVLTRLADGIEDLATGDFRPAG
jgi:enoyl-CoA hydratase